MASTTLISEEQQVAAAREAEAKAAQYTSAYNLSGAPQMRARQAASTHQLGQSSRIEEETGLGEHYEDGHPVQGPRSSSGTPSPASPSSPPTNPSLTNMLLARPRQRHGAW